MVPEVTRNYNPTEMGGRAWNNLWWVPVKLSRQTYFCLDVFGWTNIITSYLYSIKFPIIRSVNDSENKVSQSSKDLIRQSLLLTRHCPLTGRSSHSMAVQCGFKQTQWQIQERPPPPFLDQTEAQRAKKYIFETSPDTSPHRIGCDHKSKN